MKAPWHGALLLALTGEEADLGVQERSDLEAFSRTLADLGWTAQRLQEHALSAVESGSPWPHPVPADRRVGIGAAQFAAAVLDLRAALGLGSLLRRPPSPSRALTADERRLLAEAPPHHVQH